MNTGNLNVRASVLILGLGLAWLSVAEAAEPSYQAEVERWRKEYEDRLTSDEGWLTIAGLYWLREGENRFGSDPLNDFVFPEGSVPANVGVFEYHDGVVEVRIEPGIQVTQHGKAIDRARMAVGPEDTISIGDLRLWVHYSGERLAIRLRNLNSALRKEFTGLRWFPVREAYRIEGRFVFYPEPRQIEMLNILGDVENFTSPGYVVFRLGDQDLQLQATSSDGKRLFFVLRDLTSGKETYPSARFLRAERKDDDTVELDFNKAYNPPCAYNPHTTCPIPPKENRLPVRIEAGEMNYHKSSY